MRNIQRVSVVIPCYRQGHMLSQAIDSVLTQSYPEVEIIVVNDGSDDNTGEVAVSYSDRIHYVLQDNAGLAAARNTGIAAASGRYLLFLDADDMLHRNAVAWLMDAMDEVAMGRFCLMGHRMFREDPEADGDADALPGENQSPLPDLLFFNFGPPHCYLCSRHDIQLLGGFRPQARGCEDWDLWIRIALHGTELIVVPKAGAYYRRYAGSMSRDPLLMGEGRLWILHQLNQAIRHDPKISKLWKPEETVALLEKVCEEICQELLDSAYWLREKGEYIKSVQNYLLSARWCGFRMEVLSGLWKVAIHRLLGYRRETRRAAR